eukprot:Rmarinus@m.17465
MLFTIGVGLVILYLIKTFFFTKKRRDRPPPPPPKKKRSSRDHGQADVLILHGSQTGTAESFAGKLAKEINATPGKKANIVDSEEFMDLRVETDTDVFEFAKAIKHYKVVVIIVSTYGEGDPPDNTLSLYRLLLSTSLDRFDEKFALDKTVFPPVDEPYQKCLEGVEFAVFGLGDTNYEHYSAMGKFFDDRMSKMGASRLLKRGEGNDESGELENEFNEWKSNLLPLIKGADAAGSSVEVGGKTYTFAACYPIALDYTLEKAPEGSKPPERRIGVTMVPVAVKKELHTELSDRSCVHVEFDLKGSGLSYQAGDHVGIYASLRDEHVTELATLLGVVDELDALYTFRPRDPEARVNTHAYGDDALRSSHSMSVFSGKPFVLREALSKFVDTITPPSQALLVAMGEAAEHDEEKARLFHLASREGREDYRREILKPHLTVNEVLRKFPSVHLDLAILLELAPRLKVRYYSISSSPIAHRNSLHVTCAVVRYQKPSGSTYHGVCSTWLQNLKVGESVPVFIRRSTFKLPALATTPILMVGPGTGLAPFRGFLHERRVFREERGEEHAGKTVLYFGCRHRDHDFIYREELELMEKDGVLSEFHRAFSREPSSTPDRKYVQHMLREQSDSVFALMNEGGYLYICGDGKAMAVDVQKELAKIIATKEDCSVENAEAKLRKFKRDARLQLDVW